MNLKPDPRDRHIFPGATLLACLFLLATASAHAELRHIGSEQTLGALKSELLRFGELSEGVMGVSLIHLETGTRLNVHGDERFPMASTYKIPTAVTLLYQVDEGQRALAELVEVRQADLVLSQGVSAHFRHPGIKLSLRNLLEPMLIVSDNTATDVLMREVGGPATINQTLDRLGVTGIQVNRNTNMLIRDYLGMAAPAPGEARSLLEEYEAMSAEERAGLETYRSDTFADDPRDTATPNGMAELLEAIWTNDMLAEQSSEIIRDIMLRCETGQDRLRGMLPDGTPVAHKTGTLGGTSNDVGVIELPHGKGRLVIAVFIKKSATDDYGIRDRAIAEAARSAYDYFVFNVVSL